MIFCIFGVKRGDVELLHPGDHLGASEIAEGVAGDAKLDGRGSGHGLGFFIAGEKHFWAR